MSCRLMCIEDCEPICMKQERNPFGTEEQMTEQATEFSTDCGMMESAKLALLRAYLERANPGRIEETTELEVLLSACWDEFVGSREHGMAGKKLRNRMEEVYWHSSQLSFDIERHEQTCRGSTYATVQSWCIDLTNMTAAVIDSRKRQVHKPEPKLDTDKLAASTALAIRKKRNSRLLQWNPDGSVKVLIKKIIPQHTVKQTIETRSLRFKTQLVDRLKPHGWELVHILKSMRCEFRLRSPAATPPD